MKIVLAALIGLMSSLAFAQNDVPVTRYVNIYMTPGFQMWAPGFERQYLEAAQEAKVDLQFAKEVYDWYRKEGRIQVSTRDGRSILQGPMFVTGKGGGTIENVVAAVGKFQGRRKMDRLELTLDSLNRAVIKRLIPEWDCTRRLLNEETDLEPY